MPAHHRRAPSPVLWRGVGATALSIGGGVRPFIRAGVAALMHLGLAGTGCGVRRHRVQQGCAAPFVRVRLVATLFRVWAETTFVLARICTQIMPGTEGTVCACRLIGGVHTSIHSVL